MKKKQGIKRKKEAKKISHIQKPEGLSLEEWQVALRKKIAVEQRMSVKNVGTHPVFSTFRVRNPATDKTYRVVIAGEALGINYCSCPDFSINTLGTCKHIESILRRLRRKKGGRQALREGFHPEYSAVTLRYGLQRRASFLLGREASEKLKKIVSEFFDEKLFLTDKGFQCFDEFMLRTSVLKDEIQYHNDAMEFIADARDMELGKRRLKKAFPKGIDSPRWKHLLKAELYPYQREGALFASFAGRSLIADEMGLGKTIQAIAASEIMAECFGIEKVLVVCPASLKFQWKQEIERFANRGVQIIQGLLPYRHRQYQEKSFFKIVNYDVIHRDIAPILEWGPDLIILDEAQRIKNWKTRMAQSVKQLKSPYALVLTGTPLENRLEELHSIVEFIDRYHLGPLFRFLHKHQIVNEKGKVVGYRNLNRLGDSLKKILVRRKSKEVLSQLPERINKNYFITMTKEQQDIHNDNKDTVVRIASKWNRNHFLTEKEKQILMMSLQNMRMVCDNTYLIDQDMIHGPKIDELEVQLKEIFENPRAKVVIFSQWLRMMELITRMLKVNGWNYAFLHGGVPSGKRGELIKAFKKDAKCRIFLSTEAGSVGLNLQNAAFVINIDLPWNPAILEQRISRVHRMGQKNPVHVINFISQGGLEHGILGLLKFKHSMFSGVLDKGDNEVFMGTTKFNRFMKTVEKATESLEDKDDSNKESYEKLLKEREVSMQEITEEHEIKAQKQRDRVTRRGLEGEDSLKTMLRLGASFLKDLSNSLDGQKPKEASSTGPKLPLGIRISTDKDTGRKTFQIPVPEEKTLNQLKEVMGSFLNILK
ncbi:MAG: DEAD/DEAH box helicase [Candidatus Omnitrophica bacterium]|nr:DEAD/DEAH box helicase [Candidatus Omnitrophota bacterium]